MPSKQLNIWVWRSEEGLRLKIYRLTSAASLKVAFNIVGLKEMAKEKNKDKNEKSACGQALQLCNTENMSEENESVRKR